MFEVVDRAAAGRIGRLKTAHGTVTTPTLLPVIHPKVQLIPARELRSKFGAEMVITNSYILRKHDELRERALAEGLHAVLEWDGPTMTDSGTFQSYMYGDRGIDADEIVAFERAIGTDVGTILDMFIEPDFSREKAEAHVDETLRRAARASEKRGDMLLACTVQGGVFPELRERCARAVAPLGQVFPIGGVVPLMEQQRYAELSEVILASKRGLPAGNPVHLFGAGHPQVFALAAALGCDLFDSSSYIKYARDSRMMFLEGTKSLGDLEELPCVCPVCASHSVRELRGMPDDERERALAEHNLHVSFAELRRVREAIRDGSLWDLVEQRSVMHPSFRDALRVLEDPRHVEWLERREPTSARRAFFHLTDHSPYRPLLARLHHRLETRYRAPANANGLLLLPEAQRPFSDHYRDLVTRLRETNPGVVVAVRSALGTVPLDLDEVYPFSQSVVPRDARLLDHPVISGHHERFVAALGLPVVERRPDETVAELVARLPPSTGEAPHPDLARIRAVCDLQFGPGAAKLLLSAAVGEASGAASGAGGHRGAGKVRIVKSPATGKIRRVYADGQHVLSMRASDGLFTLKIDGAKRLLALPKPRLRAVVHDDSATFNRGGKNVFARFTTSMDPDLRPGDECLVVTANDDLVACGRVNLVSDEWPTFASGMSVRVREGIAAPVLEAEANQ